MLSAILSFLGGSAFRMIWGEVSAFFIRKQEHAQELERLKIQAELDDRAHQRQQETIRLQAELGVKQIEVQSDADVSRIEADAFLEAMRSANKPTGIQWVDAWNSSIRPQYAEVALAMWIAKLWQQNFIMDSFDIGLMAVVAGFFFADRTLRKMAK